MLSEIFKVKNLVSKSMMLCLLCAATSVVHAKSKKNKYEGASSMQKSGRDGSQLVVKKRAKEEKRLK